MKIGLIRLDKIGDLVCTLPVDEMPALSGHDVTWVISKGLGFVPTHAVPMRKFLELSKAAGEFWKLLRFFRKNKFDMLISFQAPWWVSLAAFVTRIPVRAGVLSQWHSFLFLNRGLRQRRSKALKHEADYNADLVLHAMQTESQGPSPILKMRASQGPIFPSLSNYVVVHPGMAGSALNWPQENYAALIRLISTTRPVVITGTEADEEWLKEIRRLLQGEATVHWAVGSLNAGQLLATLENAKLVIAPSTGVAHLAAALGQPVLAFFSPILVQRPTRWAPRGSKIKILMPNKPDMSLITVSEAFDAAKALL